jgi:hypothetical protein
MKQKLFFTVTLLALSLIVFGQKQPILKVFAYSQASLKGVRPGGGVEEGGTEIKQVPAQHINYYFYIEYASKKKFFVSALWINRKSFQIKADTIRQTPVEIISTGKSKKTVLVPATKNKILLLIPGAEKNSVTKLSASLKKLVSKNEMVIVYEWKGKIYYYAISKIKLLEPVAAA